MLGKISRTFNILPFCSAKIYVVARSPAKFAGDSAEILAKEVCSMKIAKRILAVMMAGILAIAMVVPVQAQELRADNGEMRMIVGSEFSQFSNFNSQFVIDMSAYQQGTYLLRIGDRVAKVVKQ